MKKKKICHGDYKNIVKSYIKKDDEILDLDTGGGEFLLSLSHPYSKTSATEAYPPNAASAKRSCFLLVFILRK